MSPRRDLPKGRRGPIRAERACILIVCGADKTETAYFKGLRDARHMVNMSVAIIEKGKASPDEVVRHAKRKMAGENYLQVWCVADGVPDAVERARKLAPTGREHTKNPSTGVWRLVKLILEQS